MEFMRQNLVLIIVAALVVVVGGLLLVTNLNVDKQIVVSTSQRVKLSSALKRLDKTRVNERIVAEEERRVKMVEEAYTTVLTESADWNRRSFNILTATVTDSQGDPKEIPAFPVNKSDFDEHGRLLKFKLTQAYIDQMNALLTPLLVATPPTEEDVEKEIPRAKYMLQKSSDEFRSVSSDDPELNRRAREQARDTVRQRSIAGKHLFAEPTALRFVFDAPNTDATIEDLWTAQLNLWVMGEVLSAIQETNEQVVQKVLAEHPDTPPSVAISAVRHLVSLKVLGYSADGSATSPASGGVTLTERVSNQLYDTVYYDLTVIMPLRHVADFEHVLMSHNLHTVLNTMMVVHPQQPDSLFFYGPEPVVQVTFTGELLLLASWTRGTWNAEANAWSDTYPPLMPASVLETLPSAAMRREDKKRIGS